MSCQILLHKARLTRAQKTKLAKEGVIAIQTETPEDFRFLNLDHGPIVLDDMVWACVDAINSDRGYNSDICRNLVKNLKVLAEESRSRKKP